MKHKTALPIARETAVVEQWETIRLKINELLTHFNLKHNKATPADIYELNYIKKQIDFLEKLMVQ